MPTGFKPPSRWGWEAEAGAANICSESASGLKRWGLGVSPRLTARVSLCTHVGACVCLHTRVRPLPSNIRGEAELLQPSAKASARTRSCVSEFPSRQPKGFRLFFFFLPSIDLTQIVQLWSKGILFFFRQKPPLQEPSAGNGSSPRRGASGTTSGPHTQLCPGGSSFPTPQQQKSQAGFRQFREFPAWEKARPRGSSR